MSWREKARTVVIELPAGPGLRWWPSPELQPSDRVHGGDPWDFGWVRPPPCQRHWSHLSFISKHWAMHLLQFHLYGAELPFANKSFFPISEAGMLLSTLLHNWHHDKYNIRGGKKIIRDTHLQKKHAYTHSIYIYTSGHSFMICFYSCPPIGTLAHLRIGPTWKRTGCMPCWVMCTSWFGKAWTAGQLITPSNNGSSHLFGRNDQNVNQLQAWKDHRLEGAVPQVHQWSEGVGHMFQKSCIYNIYGDHTGQVHDRDPTTEFPDQARHSDVNILLVPFWTWAGFLSEVVPLAVELDDEPIIVAAIQATDMQYSIYY